MWHILWALAMYLEGWSRKINWGQMLATTPSNIMRPFLLHLLCWMWLCRNREEQNLVAYPHDGKIYFCTSQDIPPENELLFYYSRDYAQQIGKSMRLVIVSLGQSHQEEDLIMILQWQLHAGKLPALCVRWQNRFFFSGLMLLFQTNKLSLLDFESGLVNSWNCSLSFLKVSKDLSGGSTVLHVNSYRSTWELVCTTECK